MSKQSIHQFPEDFRLQTHDFTYVGHQLSRPECILADRRGHLWISDEASAILHIAPDGTQRRLGNIKGKPNGIALTSSGQFLVSDIEHGILYQLNDEGQILSATDSINGRPMGAVNFVLADQGCVWGSVSTRTVPRSRAIETPIPDGYIFKMDGDHTEILADGFCFTNEIRFDPTHSHLYAAETTNGRIVRMELLSNGKLGKPEVYGPDGIFEGAKVDGITFDEAGNLWVTEVIKNAIYVIRPDGELIEIYKDPEGRILDAPTSITFCGPDRRTAIVGSLRMQKLAAFRAPFPGAMLSHW